MPRAQGSLINLGASHQTAPIEIREKFALSAEQMARIYPRIQAVPGISEVALLSTCNRTEVYAVIENPDDSDRLLDAFCELQQLDRDAFVQHGFEKHDAEAAQHLFEVAAGLDSLVIGETEILGQVKAAYSTAKEQQAAGPLLNRLFQKSFQAAKWVRTHTSIGKGQVSVGTVAVDLALKIFGNLGSSRILVVGAGEISERTITALKSRGATRLTVCNRTDQKAMDLANQYGGRALPYEQFPDAVGRYDIVICSTSSPAPILHAEILRPAMKSRTYQPLFLIDLALPRDIDSSVGQLENVYLYNIDDLSEIAEGNLALRRSETDRCREILAKRADHFWKSTR